ncbi:MAG TPA: penicillin-insensitive murein endopeptidase [Polyangiaceae bacterium]|nr:penicillin-insensitive murein endopeptidase [Polyangiaceae bacterium]
MPRRASGLALAGVLGVATACAPPSERAATGLVRVASATAAPPAPDVAPPQRPVRALEFPFLEGEPRDVSVSVGDTSHGRLVGARELVESESLAILPKQKARDLRYGTEGLVALLEHAADVVHRETKTKLWVGNLGRREGGDIPWSVSHNAGRDADVAFAYVDPAGNPVDPPDLVALGKNGASKDGALRLDARRTWITVRAMIEQSGADIQYLFVSEPLKKKILEQAKLLRAPAALVDKASNLLRQPRGAAPHDDHIHVRIYCSVADAACGCVDTGPTDAVSLARIEAKRAAAARARVQLEDGRADVRRRATLRLGMIGEPGDRPVVTKRLDDPDASVRAAAAATLAAFEDDEDAAILVARFRDERDPAAAAAMLEAAASLGGGDAGALLRDLIAMDPYDAATIEPFALPIDKPDDLAGPLCLLAPPLVDATTPFDRATLRRIAVRAAARADRLEPVAPLLGLVDVRDPELAKDALASLASITNHALPKSLDDADAITRAGGELTALAKSMGAAPRDAWLVRGFASRGFQVKSLDRRFGWELVRATADVEPLSYNARKLLARMLGEPSDVVAWGTGDACRHFHGELLARRAELGVGVPNDAQRVACWTTPKDAD